MAIHSHLWGILTNVILRQLVIRSAWRFQDSLANKWTRLARRPHTTLIYWVGHLIKDIDDRREESLSLFVFDYANPGDTVARMKLAQVGRQFVPHAGTHPEWAPWCSSDSLFVTWIGINDCTWDLRLQVSSAKASLDDLFATQEALYCAGARNFYLIDVPPAHEFPKGTSSLPAVVVDTG